MATERRNLVPKALHRRQTLLGLNWMLLFAIIIPSVGSLLFLHSLMAAVLIAGSAYAFCLWTVNRDPMMFHILARSLVYGNRRYDAAKEARTRVEIV